MNFVISLTLIIVGLFFGMVASDQLMMNEGGSYVVTRIFVFYGMAAVGTIVAFYGSWTQKG